MEYNSDQLALHGIFGLTSSFLCDANIKKNELRGQRSPTSGVLISSPFPSSKQPHFQN